MTTTRNEDTMTTRRITFTGNRVIEALAVEGFAGAAWEHVGGGCHAVVAPVTYAGGVLVGHLTLGNSAETMTDANASVDSIYVQAEDLNGDYFHIDGFTSDASDAEYSYAECLTMQEVVRAVYVARDALVARHTAR
jgi:hypothetical protein